MESSRISLISEKPKIRNIPTDSCFFVRSFCRQVYSFEKRPSSSGASPIKRISVSKGVSEKSSDKLCSLNSILLFRLPAFFLLIVFSHASISSDFDSCVPQASEPQHTACIIEFALASEMNRPSKSWFSSPASDPGFSRKSRGKQSYSGQFFLKVLGAVPVELSG